MSTPLAERPAIDEAFLGLSDIDGGVRFTVESRLARPDRRLFGGTAIAVSLAAIERVSERDALWATAQLVGTAPVGATVDCAVDVLAQGHRTSQLRVTATSEGEVVFQALGAAATLKEPERALVGQGGTMPGVTPPEQSRTFWSGSGDENAGWHGLVEMRSGADDVGGERGRVCLWMRLVDGEPWTPARLSFVADMVPLAVCRTTGSYGAGTSLDNSLRMGRLVDTEWVLLDLYPHAAWGGYGTGTGVMWAQDGTLLAVASQTCTIFEMSFDPLDIERVMKARPDL
jgi:acyl-CoA thioesterase II